MTEVGVDARSGRAKQQGQVGLTENHGARTPRVCDQVALVQRAIGRGKT